MDLLPASVSHAYLFVKYKKMHFFVLIVLMMQRCYLTREKWWLHLRPKEWVIPTDKVSILTALFPF